MAPGSIIHIARYLCIYIVKRGYKALSVTKGYYVTVVNVVYIEVRWNDVLIRRIYANMTLIIG